jgi:hypothetical protein
MACGPLLSCPTLRPAAMELIKPLIVIVLLAIVISLGSALFHLSSSKGDSAKMLRSLTVRISLSVALFLLLLIASRYGLITPHQIGR